MKRMKQNAGFTMVELLVVIAILGILGGIGTVGYNGYIQKSKEAADQQLLAAVNTAFATACTENKVEMPAVTDSTMSILGQKVYGLSTLSVGGSAVDDALLIKVASSFQNYYAGNENASFVEPGVNSLTWDAGKSSFVTSVNATNALVFLDNGKVINISAEDMAAAQASSFAAMGVTGVTKTIESVNGSAKALAMIARPFDSVFSKLTNKMVQNGYVDSTEAAKNLTDEQLANGLQMCVAEYLSTADSDDMNRLVGLSLGSNTLGMLNSLSNSGGSETTAALAVQYAMVQSLAQNSSNEKEITVTKYEKTGTNSWGLPIYENVTYEYTISEYLATDDAKNDPVAAIATVKGTDSYKSYVGTEQYQKDLNGFAATMGAVGGNLDAIDTDKYLDEGIGTDSAQAVLGALLS